MVNYYLSKSTGKHDYIFLVHRESCKLLSDISNRAYLGNFKNCTDTIDRARKFYPHKVNGCSKC